jgi:hypothetical protein
MFSPVVTGKKNGPTAAHEGGKRQPNLYPVPGGIVGSPCPWGYKYDKLDHLVGGWATGRHPVAVKKPTVKKPKLCPQNSQSDWKRPGQWKRNHVMRIAIWNVRSLYCTQQEQ